MPREEVDIAEVLRLGDAPVFLIGGPCVIESIEICLEIGRTLKAACDEQGIAYVFKASFDKANRTSGESFRGPGIGQGLAVLEKVKRELESGWFQRVTLPLPTGSDLAGPVRADDQERLLFQASAQMKEQMDRALIRPLHIVEQHQQRRMLHHGAQQTRHLVEEGDLLQGRVDGKVAAGRHDLLHAGEPRCIAISRRTGETLE